MAGMGTASVLVLVTSTGEVGGTWGSTASVATRKLHGLTEATFTLAEVAEAVPLVGYAGPSPIAERTQQSAEFTIPGVATYEEFPKFLNGFFVHTSQSTGAAAPYPYFYGAPTFSTQTNLTYGFEAGTTVSPYRVRGGIFNGLTISGEAGGNWTFSIDGFAKAIEVSSGMAAAAVADTRSMTPVAMKDTNLRFSPFSTGTYATSSGEVSATLISFELTYNPNRHLKWFAGSAWPQAWGDARGEGSLRTVLEFNTTAQTIINEMLGTSSGVSLQRQIQIYASAASSAQVASIDFAGMVSEPVQFWNDRDGNCTIELNWTGKFTTAQATSNLAGSTAGNWLNFRWTNGSSSTT